MIRPADCQVRGAREEDRFQGGRIDGSAAGLHLSPQGFGQLGDNRGPLRVGSQVVVLGRVRLVVVELASVK